MKTWLSTLAACLAISTVHGDIPRIIFDTDITGDVDDVLALAMLHSLADRGACHLLGVTISKQNPQTAAFVDAQNTFYGRPDLPIGVTRDETAQKRESRYLKLADSANYPHNIRSNDDVPEAVALLRQLLAAQPDGSVSLVSVGIASNMANLLRSKADTVSPLDGPTLIRQKVKLLSIMAGAFETIDANNHFLEANVINGIAAMQTVARDWPQEVPVVWSGYEIGVSLPYPRQSIARDFDYVPHHIVKEAYLLHSGPEHDRPCWDQSSVLYAVFPDRDIFGLSKGGWVSVENDGFTRFTLPKKDNSSTPRDRFLTLTSAQRARALEAMVHLTAQPPRK
ncbi:Inosine-uridine preferring nucleoside hydrolase [Prosthecobacter debontii]|uniref:Inosine-uridine preferring nucleoside hydrolase n=1 Tax=Prosthecobacter debontii TaxID=48467 RepID=A0A1T4WF05_9BACT|nr:nucleoside hydrolase [Prosthecobacter debontii]SKA75777.1 Inosine-uridine preferring nucleoside hydrolase [Prosthecobacter debontii]